MGIYSQKAHHKTDRYQSAVAQKDGVLRQKGWATPYGFIDFKKPMTYEEACAEMKPLYEKYFNQTKEEEN